MVSCFAPDCTHSHERDQCSFFRFPANIKLRKKWIALCRRQDREPGPASRICSCHFQDGNKESGPVIFKRNYRLFVTKRKTRTALQVISVPGNCNENRIEDLGGANTSDCISSNFIDVTVRNDTGSHTLESVKVNPLHDDHLYCALKESSMEKSTDEICSPSSTNLDESTIQEPNSATQEPNSATQEPNSATQEPNSATQELNPKVIQTSPTKLLLSVSNSILLSENEELRTVKDINLRNSRQFNFSCIRGNDKYVEHYTGLPSAATFDIVLKLCQRFPFKYYLKWKVTCLTYEDQLFLTLCKLRHNFSQTDLSVRFCVSVGVISNVFLTWVHLLHSILHGLMMRDLPPLKKTQKALPACFSKFRNCRVILDCTEIEIAVPRSSMHQQSTTYSHYKQRNTFKGLIGVSPNGVIVHVSKLYGGSTSDKEIVLSSGILSQLSPGDLVLADKGFLIHDILPTGVTLNIPPFLVNGQFTVSEVEKTTAIASARIHVERAIQRIKAFRILNFIPYQYRQFASVIFQSCSYLVNFQNSILKEVS